MKSFQALQIREAEAWSLQGGQALHLHRIVFPNSPQCFRKAVECGEDICHLLDQNLERLIRTAKSFGVNIIVVEYEGKPFQHIDLCGAPLKKALQIANAPQGLL